MAQLGKAFIEVRADLSKFPAELRAELEKALKEGTAGITFKEFEDKAGLAGEEAGKRISQGLEKTSKTRSKKTGEKMAEDVGLGFFGVLKKIFSSSGSSGGTNGFFNTIGDLFKGFTKSAEDGFSKLSDLGSKIGDIGSKVGSAFSAIGGGIQAGLYTLAVPAVGALLAVVTQLSGAVFALPAAIAPLIAIFATLKVATEGVGAAISAGFSAKNAAQIKAYNEALKGLAPSARAVVKEIVGLKGAFDVIKNNAQQALFAPLIGSFAALKGTLLPALNQGFSTAAAALGRFAKGFLELFSEPAVIAAITQTFATLARILDRIGPAASALFGSLFGLIRAGLPFIEKFSAYLATAGEALAKLIDKANSGGKIAGFIAAAAQPFKELIKLAAVLGDLFFTIFGNSGIQKAGNDFLNYLIKAIGLLDKFFKSAEGKKVLADFASAIEHAGLVLVGVAAAIIGLLEAIHYLNAALSIAIKSIGAFFAFIGGVAVTAGKAIVDFFVAAGKAIGDFFVHGIPSAFNAVVGFFKSIGSAIGDFFTKTIPSWFNQVIKFFQDLPKKAGDGLGSLRTTILHAFESAFFGLVDSVSRNIGHVVGLILASPFLIKTGLEHLGTIISDAFTSALDFARLAVTTGIHDIIHFFADTLPSALGTALDFVKAQIVLRWNNTLAFFEGLGPAIGHAFEAVYHAIVDHISQALADAKSFVVNGFNDIIHFFATLPDRIAALGPKLLNAAKDLGRQIGNGLKDIGNFASNIGHDIVNTIKSGINRIIDGINSGIADIDNAIPISLPRLPKFEHGGIIDSPTVALLGEKNKREVVVPLTDPARAQQLAAQSGLTKILARGAGQPIVNITAILGTGQILDILDQRVTTAFDNQGTELAYGPRS